MSVSTLANTHVEFDIGGQTFKVRKLSIMDIFVEFEREVRQDYINNINEMVKVLPATDRKGFLADAIKEMPAGKRLEDLANERIATVQGGLKLLHAVLSKCQPVTPDEAMALAADNANAEAIAEVMAYAVTGEKRPEGGAEKKEQGGKTGGDTSVPSSPASSGGA